MKTILVDVDSTVAQTLPEWVRMYNQDYYDVLDYRLIDDWEMTKFVSKECGVKIYNYLSSPRLYDNVQPFDGALDVIRWIRRAGHRVVYVSAGVEGALAKFKWLEREGFEPGNYAQDFVSVYDKSLIKGDLLIDDRDKNIQEFGSMSSILMDMPYNRNFSWHYRAETWQDVKEYFYEMQNYGTW